MNKVETHFSMHFVALCGGGSINLCCKLLESQPKQNSVETPIQTHVLYIV